MKNKLKGLTLLETMLYIGLFSIIIIIVLNFMLSTQEATLRTQRRANLYQTSTFIMEHISDTVGKAESIDIGNSIFSDSNGKLTIVIQGETKEYTFEDSKLYYDGILLSPASVIVRNFYLYPIYKGADKVIGVKIISEITSLGDSDLKNNINMLAAIR
jgi:type II secretory pathway pseudopilin PulG